MSTLKQYAISAAAFILRQLSAPDFNHIERVILFGSVARGASTNESDIDLFFEVRGKASERVKLKKTIKEVAETFSTSNEGLSFRLKGTANPLAVLVGQLKDWPDLEKNIAKGSILLYGQHFQPLQGEPQLLIWWKAPATKKRGAFLNALYGVKIKNKRYTGLLEKFGCGKVGKSATIVPMRHKLQIEALLQKYKVPYKVIEISLI